MTSVRIIKGQTRLALAAREPGGISLSFAIQRAQAMLDARRADDDLIIHELIDALRGWAQRRTASQEDWRSLQRSAMAILDVCCPARDGDLAMASRLLCAYACGDGGRAPEPEGAWVFVDALRVIATRGSTSQTASVLLGLSALAR